MPAGQHCAEGGGIQPIIDVYQVELAGDCFTLLFLTAEDQLQLLVMGITYMV